MSDTRVAPEPVLDRPPDQSLRARLWIGQNPVAFVALCLWVGYWVGRLVAAGGDE